MTLNRSETAVVSGAACAIGRVIVQRLVSRGLDVVAVGRNIAALEELAASLPTSASRSADLSDDAAIEIILAALDRPVRMIVHCVGVPVACVCWKRRRGRCRTPSS